MWTATACFTDSSEGPEPSYTADQCEALGVPVCINDNECSGHGQCHKSGSCECSPDWFGKTCNVSIFHSTSYLPDIFPTLADWNCHQVASLTTLRDSLFQNLEDLHQPQSCSADGASVFSLRPHGLGAQIHWMSVALDTAFRCGSSRLLGSSC